MRHDRLELPTGQLVTAQQELTGVALLALDASKYIEVAHQILKDAGVLKNRVVNKKLPIESLFINVLITKCKAR